jgi:hypothetical protein
MGVITIEKVKFIAYYTRENVKVKRVSSPAGNTVVDYISKVIARNGYDVEIISPSWEEDSAERGFAPCEEIKISDNINLKITPTFSGGGKMSSSIKKGLSRLWLISYILFKIKKEDLVFVYHQLTLMMPVKLIFLLKRNRVIMVTEELYTNIPKFKDIGIEKEIDCPKSLSLFCRRV